MTHYETTKDATCTVCSSEMPNSSTHVTPLFSNTDRQIYEVVNYVFISGAISLFGVVTNIINITVFYKQGFHTTVNISFFALSISDMCSLVLVLWFGVCVNPLFVYSDIDIWPADISYLTAGMPHICFARITGWITVFVTAERCLCIALPLKIKQIVTPRRTTVTIIVIYVVIMSTFVPEYATAYHGWKFFEERNRTLLGLCFTRDHYKVDGLAFFMYSVLGSASFVAVIIFTLLLVIELRRKSRWRMQVTTSREQSNATSNKEKKTMIMVVMISLVLIVCYTPGAIVSMVTSFEAEFGVFGVYVNAFYVMWSFVFVMETLNSSINIFFYYTMSMKYRHTLRLMLTCLITDLVVQKTIEKEEYLQ